MDAADERLRALKKAYADVILSISKEAAARVMASERKSVRCQHELKVVNEEGVRMLMRLKQMMDSQISEAETAALNQQKKIEELEAQLEEAEDIVRDLREELGEVQTQLDRLKSENSNSSNEPGNAYSKEVPLENNISSYQSCKNIPPIVSSAGSDACGVHIKNRDLPSIIVRGKDPGLYRNGRTQRIRACQRTVLDGHLRLLEETNKMKDEKNGGKQKEGAKLLEKINLGTFKSFSRKKKRAVRQRKAAIMLGGKRSYLSPKIDQLPEHSLTINTILVDNDACSAENPSEICPTILQDMQTRLPSEKTSENETNIMEIDGAKKVHEDAGEREKAVPLREVTGFSQGLQKMDVEKVDVPSQSRDSNLSVTTIGGKVIKYTYQRKRKRQALNGNETNGSSETEKKMGERKNGNQQLEQHKPRLVEESLGDLMQCGSQVNVCCETEKETGDRQCGDRKVEQPEPSLLKESSRDHRRLAQVARQLISLSEKKWWH